MCTHVYHAHATHARRHTHMNTCMQTHTHPKAFFLEACREGGAGQCGVQPAGGAAGGAFAEGLAGMELARLSACFPRSPGVRGDALHQLSRGSRRNVPIGGTLSTGAQPAGMPGRVAEGRETPTPRGQEKQRPPPQPPSSDPRLPDSPPPRLPALPTTAGRTLEL